MKTFPLQEAPLQRWDREQGPQCGKAPRVAQSSHVHPRPSAETHPAAPGAGHEVPAWATSPEGRFGGAPCDTPASTDWASVPLGATPGQQRAGREARSRCGRRQTGSQEEGAHGGPARLSYRQPRFRPALCPHEQMHVLYFQTQQTWPKPL